MSIYCHTTERKASGKLTRELGKSKTGSVEPVFIECHALVLYLLDGLTRRRRTLLGLEEINTSS